jgi:hypothetical protein
MINTHDIVQKLYRQRLFFCMSFFFLCSLSSLQAQPQQPPRPVIIYTNPAQGLFFGAFYHGAAGGSVIVYPDGSRSATGDVVQLGLGQLFAPAIFEIEAPIGTRLGILNGPDAVLSGSNGGTMTMQVGDSDVGNHFVTTIAAPGRTQVRVGGILNVGNSLANPPGAYSGMFQITFVQE